MQAKAPRARVGGIPKRRGLEQTPPPLGFTHFCNVVHIADHIPSFGNALQLRALPYTKLIGMGGERVLKPTYT